MKISNSQLRQIILEEIQKSALDEAWQDFFPTVARATGKAKDPNPHKNPFRDPETVANIKKSRDAAAKSQKQTAKGAHKELPEVSHPSVPKFDMEDEVLHMGKEEKDSFDELMGLSAHNYAKYQHDQEMFPELSKDDLDGIFKDAKRDWEHWKAQVKPIAQRKTKLVSQIEDSKVKLVPTEKPENTDWRPTHVRSPGTATSQPTYHAWVNADEDGQHAPDYINHPEDDAGPWNAGDKGRNVLYSEFLAVVGLENALKWDMLPKQYHNLKRHLDAYSRHDSAKDKEAKNAAHARIRDLHLGDQDALQTAANHMESDPRKKYRVTHPENDDWDPKLARAMPHDQAKHQKYVQGEMGDVLKHINAYVKKLNDNPDRLREVKELVDIPAWEGWYDDYENLQQTINYDVMQMALITKILEERREEEQYEKYGRHEEMAKSLGTSSEYLRRLEAHADLAKAAGMHPKEYLEKKERRVRRIADARHGAKPIADWRHQQTELFLMDNKANKVHNRPYSLDDFDHRAEEVREALENHLEEEERYRKKKHADDLEYAQWSVNQRRGR